MKIAVPTRHRRLFVLCACSAAVHFAVLQLLAAHGPGPTAAAPAAGELSVRLVPSRAVAAPAAPASPMPTVPNARAAQDVPARAAAATPAPAPAPVRSAAAPASAVSPTAAQAATSPTASSAATSASASTEPAPPPMLMPGRYHVGFPPPVLLTYDVARAGAGGLPAPAGTAQLSWRTDGTRYLLDVDGATGRLHSEGAGGDAGILPQRASEVAAGATLVTEFDGDGGRVLFRAAGTEAPDNVGIQDRASLLMQLTGMGLADPEQIAGTIEIVVAGARDLRVARFEVLGQEDVTTGTGVLAAWHLAERAAPGQPRLDVWLAPQQGWLPVRIRVDDGGASVTQTLRAVAPAPPLPAAAPAGR